MIFCPQPFIYIKAWEIHYDMTPDRWTGMNSQRIWVLFLLITLFCIASFGGLPLQMSLGVLENCSIQ